MEIIHHIQDLRTWRKIRYQKNESVCFVPTMGALHEGHLSLIKEGKRKGDQTIVSIFVNPTQFNDPKDFDRYPRTIDIDIELAKNSGCDAIFIPDWHEIYPQNPQIQSVLGQESMEKTLTQVIVKGISDPLCGHARPGHFNGVGLVVSILFNLVQPDMAFFGEKDFQQLAIIRQMTKELHFPIEIIGMPTLREKDGLAMSSRNQRLSQTQRQLAPCLYQALKQTEKLWQEGIRHCQTLENHCRNHIENHLKDHDYRIDYIELRNKITLQYEQPEAQNDSVLALAVFIGEVRLIDNIQLFQ